MPVALPTCTAPLVCQPWGFFRESSSPEYDRRLRRKVIESFGLNLREGNSSRHLYVNIFLKEIQRDIDNQNSKINNASTKQSWDSCVGGEEGWLLLIFIHTSHGW